MADARIWGRAGKERTTTPTILSSPVAFTIDPLRERHVYDGERGDRRRMGQEDRLATLAAGGFLTGILALVLGIIPRSWRRLLLQSGVSLLAVSFAADTLLVVQSRRQARETSGMRSP